MKHPDVVWVGAQHGRKGWLQERRRQVDGAYLNCEPGEIPSLRKLRGISVLHDLLTCRGNQCVEDVTPSLRAFDK